MEQSISNKGKTCVLLGKMTNSLYDNPKHPKLLILPTSGGSLKKKGGGHFVFRVLQFYTSHLCQK